LLDTLAIDRAFDLKQGFDVPDRLQCERGDGSRGFALRFAAGILCEIFPPWQTVYWWFRRFVRLLLFRTIHDVALMMDRERVDREASPTAGVLDSQTIKAPCARERGYDADKKITGRKRHIAVDTDGRLLMVNLTTADISDSAGAQKILDAIRTRWPWHRTIQWGPVRGNVIHYASAGVFRIRITA
jgi:transposase